MTPHSLYLLDGMALAYRAHFALIRSPIFNSAGVNTSALYGFANTLIDLVKNRKPTHLAVVFDTSAPTPRHLEYPEYKAQRDAMPEDLSQALPHIRRLCEAMQIPVITLDGFEADDIIGTLAKQAEAEGSFTTYMVTPDKDFGQLVDEKTLIYRPGTGGADPEIWGVAEVCAKWGISTPSQVIDMLGLMGDASDNIPGIPGVGEKTAKSLIEQFATVEGVIAGASQIKGKLKEKVETNAEMARLSRKLATIIIDVPLSLKPSDLARQPMNDEAVKSLFVEFEFNSLGKRLFGSDFVAGRTASQNPKPAASNSTDGDDLFAWGNVEASDAPPTPAKSIKDVEHHYRIAFTTEERAELIAALLAQPAWCFDTETASTNPNAEDDVDPQMAELVGLAFSWQAHHGWYVPVPSGAEGRKIIEEFRPVFEKQGVEKVGHNLKFDLSVLSWQGIIVAGPIFDTMLAHALLEPDQRHKMDYLSEVYLHYTPIPFSAVVAARPAGGQDDLFATLPSTMRQAEIEQVAEYAAEDADVTWQLAAKLKPLLVDRGLERVANEIENPLVPVLVEMESTGVMLDVPALKAMSQELAKQLKALEAEIHALAGGPFNLNSPKQLGEILFDRLKLGEKPKKTATGQYKTSEDILETLAPKHQIVSKILDYREASKLRSTYVDALPAQVSPRTGRVHTTYHQLLAATGRLASNNPNLQNIPIRTPMGREIRKAFVPREAGWLILSADYSQIELRVMASLSGDAAMREAFAQGHDIHSATASRVYGVPMDQLLPEMRRAAKMVNFGIIYGISAFGLAQRLGCARSEANAIIEGYFTQYPGVKKSMDRCIAQARTLGYVETLCGRRRYLRDINSSNATVRGGAERMAINTPIQGTAADMIKLAMISIARRLKAEKLRSRMLLQVHDELVFEFPEEEQAALSTLVREEMINALPLEGVPIVVETGVGKNWLEAH